jgi:toxin ParE1/3/4
MIILNWTLKAQAALDAIYDYIHSDAPIYAERFVGQIIEAVDRLGDFPFSGRVVPEAARDDIREVIFHNYRIIYRVVSAERIDILTVLHASRDLASPENQPWYSH